MVRVARDTGDHDDYYGHREVDGVSDATHDQTWSVAEAKAHLSELLDHVINDGPQTVTRRGKEVAVVVSIEEWQRKSARSGSLAEFFATSPLPGSELDLERPDVEPRDVAL
jgi:prevent-host-death family protein